MKSGLKVGQTATIHTVVTSDMFAQFEGKVVHRAYSTVAMIYHMEWASRQIILPFLEEHEEGMGGAVSATHMAPSKEGAELSVTAVLTKIHHHVIHTDVSILNGIELIGKGEVKQVILPKSKIANMLSK